MSLSDALEWAAWAAVGEYLIEYEDSGLTDEQDPGSRCGFGDDELDAIRSALSNRGLSLTADDRGLRADVADVDFDADQDS